MKTNIFVIATFFICSTSLAQLRTPNLSPSGSLKQTVGITEVGIEYSRPSAKSRAIFGELLPYGEVWRSGANSATKITFSDAIKIKGKSLEKGAYTIVSIPGEDVWKIHWYPYKSTNWNDYVKEQPILTIDIASKKTKYYTETFEIRVKNLILNKAVLALEWEYTSIEIPLEVTLKEPVLKSIARTMTGPSHIDYYRAALYLHESKIDLKKALEYIQKATVSDKALFFQVTREALILRDLGRRKEAIIAAKRALKLSQKANNKDFVRINKNLIEN